MIAKYADSSQWNNKLAITLIIFLVVLVYANTLGSSFVWDDTAVIVENSFIKSWGNFPLIFSPAYFSHSSKVGRYYLQNYHMGSGEGTYRPVVTISYFLDYQFWKLNPTGYHLTNLLLHIFNCLLLYFFINLIIKNRKLALLTSLFFALHPVNSEVVDVASFREDLLACFFYLSSLILYIKLDAYDKKKKAYFYILSLFSFFLALFSKEIAITLPLILILYDYFFGRHRLRFSRYIGYILILLFYVWVRFFLMVNKYMPPVSYPGGNFYANIFAMSRVITTYIQWLFLPINIYATVSGEPSFISRSLLEPRVLFSASLLITIFVFAFKLRKRAKEFSFSAFWFFITLLPVSNAFPLANYIASRYLYIPSAGFCFFLAFALFKLPDSAIFGAKRNILRLLAIYAIIALIMSYSIFTLARNNVFRDNISLLAEQVKKYPDNPRVHFDLGNRFREKGLLGEAIREYRIAIKFDPYHAPFHKELGIAYCQEGDLKEALNEMEMAFQLDNHLPKLAEAYNYLGYAFRDKKLYDKAIASWSKAVQLKPDYSEVYYDLGNTYADVRKNEESILAYKKAIETDPNYLEAYNNLASVYTVTGKIDKAIDLWNKAVQISPNFAIAHFNLAVFYFQKKEYGLAIKHCDKVIALGGKVDPKFLELLKPYRK